MSYWGYPDTTPTEVEVPEVEDVQMFVRVGRNWIDPRRVIALRDDTGYTTVMLDHGHTIKVAGSPDDIAQKLSDPDGTL